VDRCLGSAGVFIGVTRALPKDGHVGRFGHGTSYQSDGFLWQNGSSSSASVCAFSSGHVVRVELCFVTKTLCFFVNGLPQGQSISVDVTTPLFPTVSLAYPGEQVTLL